MERKLAWGGRLAGRLVLKPSQRFEDLQHLVRCPNIIIGRSLGWGNGYRNGDKMSMQRDNASE